MTPSMSLPPRVWLVVVPALIALLGWRLVARDNGQPGEFILANNRSSLLLATTPQRLLDIDDALVSETNLARVDGTFDYERCARLHNYLVAYGWMKFNEQDPGDLTDLLNAPSFFETEVEVEHVFHDEHQAPVHMSRLDSGLISFLQSIILPHLAQSIYYWADNLDVLSADLFFPKERKLRGKERFVILYTSYFPFASPNMGLVFDQKTNRVAMPLAMDNIDSISPIKDHLDMWLPLETVLSNWIHMIRIGKVTPGESADSSSADITGTWTWQSYSAAQVDSAVEAMDRLSAAIEARMPSTSHLSVPRESPLLTDKELDAASVPPICFIPSLLTRVKTPRFKFIAPGLEVPHDASAFAARQKFTGLPRTAGDSTVIPPVLIFASSKYTINFNEEIEWLFFTFGDPIPYTANNRIPVGLYSEFVHRGTYDVRRGSRDITEEGFRLLLPSKLRREPRMKRGAKQSDGSLVSEGSVSELFQHGNYFPFGGEWRAQRFERLMDKWRELVETGVWKVGKDGVKGGIDQFEDAEYETWRDYWIPPGW